MKCDTHLTNIILNVRKVYKNLNPQIPIDNRQEIENMSF